MAERRRRPRARSRRQSRAELPAAVRGTPSGRDPSEGQTDQRLLRRWQMRVAHARRVREEWEQEYHVETLERMYLGQHTEGGTLDKRFDIWLNHFFATIQTQRPALLPATVGFLVEPRPGQRGDQARMKARMQAGVLNALADQDDHLSPTLRLAATQAFFRVGVLKVTYDPRLGPNPQAGELMLGEDGAPLSELNGQPMREPDAILTDEVYRWRWVNARNMLLPDQGPDTTRWTWLGEQVEVSLEEAQDDPRFPKALRDQFVPNATMQDGLRLSPSVPTSTRGVDVGYLDTDVFCYYECWDIYNKRLYCWADGQPFQDFLLNEDYPAHVEDHPYSLLLPVPILMPKPCPWPKPLVYDWEPVQREYNIARGQMINAGKRSARKYYYDDNTFPDADEAQKALESAEDMQGVKLNDTARPPVAITDPSSPPEISRNVPFLRADWQIITGASGARLGDADSNTATEAVIVSQGEAVRDSELRTMILSWIGTSGRKMLQAVQQTLTLDLWVQIKDVNDADFQAFLGSEGLRAYLALQLGSPEAAAQFLQLLPILPGLKESLRERFGQLKPLKVSQEDLQMESTVVVKPSTMRPIYRTQLMQLTSLLGPAALLSPTLLEELLTSFELPAGDRIAQEILSNLRQQQQAQQPPQPGRPVPGTPNVQNGANPVGSRQPLAVVSGLGGV